jgi:hypothetical protein
MNADARLRPNTSSMVPRVAISRNTSETSRPTRWTRGRGSPTLLTTFGLQEGASSPLFFLEIDRNTEVLSNPDRVSSFPADERQLELPPGDN